MLRMGITTGPYTSSLGFKSHGVNQQYMEKVIEVGGTPFLLPVIMKDLDIMAKQYAEELDMLLLTGGSDITPILYNRNIEIRCGNFDLERDRWELKLFSEFHKLGKPIMGICRGLQIINVGLGGTLIQHMSDDYIKHWHNIERPYQKVQKVNIEGMKMESVFGKCLEVNSFHHQCIDILAEKLKNNSEFGYSEDKVIELIYNEDLSIIGVQYHPEMLADDVESRKLFELFVLMSKKIVNMKVS